MAFPSFDPNDKTSISNRYRRKRFEFFNDLLNTIPRPFRILDVGGTQAYWDSMGFSEQDIHITLLNLGTTAVTNNNFTSVKGNATNLAEYKDNEFDLVFSNSVIEHLFTWENQVKMANEVRRVGKRYFVQTPNYYFPIEPHWVFPFFQFLPKEVKIGLTKNFTLGHHPKAITRQKSVERVDEVKLLTKQKMQTLFPDGKLYYEIVFGLTKSITAYNFSVI